MSRSSLKKIKTKSNNMDMNNKKISQKMKKQRLVEYKKNIIKYGKIKLLHK